MTAQLDDLPLGASTDVPYRQANVLHLGSTTTNLRGRLAHRPGVTVVERLGPRSEQHFSFLVDGQLEPIGGGHTVRGVALSGNGEWAAWVEEEHVAGRGYRRTFDYWTVLYDTRAQRELGRHYQRRSVAWEDGINAVWLRGVNNAGQVFTSSDDHKLVMWRPGAEPIPVRGARFRGRPVDVWPGGFSYYWKGLFGLRGEKIGTVDEAGTFVEVDRTGSSPSYNFWSPEGLRMVLQRDALIELEDPVTEERAALPPLPDGGTNGPDAADFTWEDDQTLLIADEFGGRWALLRCRVGAPACERVPIADEKHQIRLPYSDLLG
ncbi:MAG: hypothetical protein WAW88_09695 [Nocardioides sp.]